MNGDSRDATAGQERNRGWVSRFAWRLYEHLPAPAEELLTRCYRYLLPFRNLRIPLHVMRGTARGSSGTATVVLAGDTSSMDCLTTRLFTGGAEMKSLGKVAVWRLGSSLRRLRRSSDLTIARLDRLSARLFLGDDYLSVPEWIGSTLEVPSRVEALTQGNPSLRSDLRLVRRNALSPAVSHDWDDFLHFYHTMYVPFIRNRHGERACIRNINWMRRAFRRGGLMWVLADGQPIGGLLFSKRGGALKSLALGTSGGAWQHVAEGCNIATDLFLLDYARERGFTNIDLGGTRPFLDDGVLRYKRKWRCTFTEKQDTYEDFLIGWDALTGPTRALLAGLPLIFRDADGLAALRVLSCRTSFCESEYRKLVRADWVPGLTRLYLAGASARGESGGRSSQTVVIDDRHHDVLSPKFLRSLGERTSRTACARKGEP